MHDGETVEKQSNEKYCGTAREQQLDSQATS